MSQAQRDTTQKYSCRCLNITINASSHSERVSEADPEYLRVFVGDEGIHIMHHYLTVRTRFHAQKSATSPDKSIQPLALSCLECNTLAYRIVQEIASDAEAREGPIVPMEDWVEQETLLSKTGWIEVFVGQGGCLVGQRAIEEHRRSVHISKTFSIAVFTPPTHEPNHPSSQPQDSQSQPPLDRLAKFAFPEQLLQMLSPLFPPPPFTPSHPVFATLSDRAIEKSTELRSHMEEEVKRFVQSQLEYLEREESQLRDDVEGIWQGFREGWKRHVADERRKLTASKSERHVVQSKTKSGAQLSIRDFSPIDRSDPELRQSNRTPPPVIPPSLLSASLANKEMHSTLSQTREHRAAIAERTSYPQSHASDPSTPLLQNNSGSQPTLSMSNAVTSETDPRMPDAFRRNMDANLDIASSLAWAQGEEELQRRFSRFENGSMERSRDRTSKNLRIGAKGDPSNSKSAYPVQDSALNAPTAQEDQTTEQVVNRVTGNVSKKSQLETIRSSPDGAVGPATGSSNESNVSRKAKRKVTFGALPDTRTSTNVMIDPGKRIIPEAEPFDIDDPSFLDDSSSLEGGRSEAVARIPPYKLHKNDNVSRLDILRGASLPARVSRWTSGSLRRSIDLADALPLLSSSVPAGDRLLTDRSLEIHEKPSRTRSPPPPGPSDEVPHPAELRSPSDLFSTFSDGAAAPAEVELRNLLAASAPSHRHAWREGGRAWEMLHKRSGTKDMKRAVAEEHVDSGSIAFEVSDSSSDGDDDDYESRDQWHDPPHLARSLPVQIRPLAGYKLSLERKTSLVETQGMLVPPLKMTRPRTATSSAADYRRAAYAERDQIRSIDPGPTLDFDEPAGDDNEDEDEDYLSGANEGDRGRRHALSILQARSVIPEAGMWRSLAS